MKLRLALAVMALCAVGGANAMHGGGEEKGSNWKFDIPGCFGYDGKNRTKYVRFLMMGPFTSPFQYSDAVNRGDGERYINSLKKQALLFKVGCIYFMGRYAYNYFTSPTKKKKDKIN